MRLPLLLALAVIIFTPANIRDVAHDAFGTAQRTVAALMGHDSGRDALQVAEGPEVALVVQR